MRTYRSGVPTAARTAMGATLLVALVAATMALVPSGAAADPTGDVVAGQAMWGVKASFRSYVTGPIGQGTITPTGLTVEAGGAFGWPATGGTHDDGAGDTDATFGGSVQFLAHAGALDMTLSGLEVHLDAGTASGTLVLDAVSRSLADGSYTTYTDVGFATLDLTGITPTSTAGGWSWASIPASLTAEGADAFAGFYPAGTALDPVTVALDLVEPAPAPQVTVSKTSGIDLAGETVTVSGTGFDPDANLSTRPPIPVGQPTGVYVVFGKFADTWQPSAGAASSTRRVIDQRWAMPPASATAAGLLSHPQYVPLNPDGTFSATLDVVPNPALEAHYDYGVVTYAAGGAAPNAAQERFTPITFDGAISGTVTAVDGGDPIGGIQVRVRDAASNTYVGSAVTAGDGSYAVAGLAPGTYVVRFTDPDANYLPVFNGGVRAFTQATPLTVAGGAATPVDQALALASSLDGTVVEAGSGTPLVDATVRVRDAGTGLFVAGTKVAADGSWSLDVPAGTYVVMYDNGSAHVRQFHDGAAGFASATPVVAAPGGTITLMASLAPSG